MIPSTWLAVMTYATGVYEIFRIIFLYQKMDSTNSIDSTILTNPKPSKMNLRLMILLVIVFILTVPLIIYSFISILRFFRNHPSSVKQEICPPKTPQFECSINNTDDPVQIIYLVRHCKASHNDMGRMQKFWKYLYNLLGMQYTAPCPYCVTDEKSVSEALELLNDLTKDIKNIKKLGGSKKIGLGCSQLLRAKHTALAIQQYFKDNLSDDFEINPQIITYNYINEVSGIFDISGDNTCRDCDSLQGSASILDMDIKMDDIDIYDDTTNCENTLLSRYEIEPSWDKFVETYLRKDSPIHSSKINVIVTHSKLLNTIIEKVLEPGDKEQVRDKKLQNLAWIKLVYKNQQLDIKSSKFNLDRIDRFYKNKS